MDAQPDDGAMAALLRLVAARTRGAEIAVYAVGRRGIRLAATTSARVWPATPSALFRDSERLLAAGVCARVDPAAFGLAAGFCALWPLRDPSGTTAGFLLFGDPHRRRLGPGVAAMLADAARIAAPLLALAAHEKPRHAAGRRAARGAFGRAPGAPADPPPEGPREPPKVVAPRTPPREAAFAPASPLECELAEAEGRGELRLVYQGYLDLADGRVSGVEALLRWRHPLRGELAPAAFIPLAEASGLILPLGAWALRAALAAAARWPPGLALSVNVSALQFRQPGFVAQIEAALAAAAVAPGRLELEITETVLMREGPETTAQLKALIGLGVRIALDDFGTGYSALAYLGRLPHHRIKLDRAFVQDLGNPATLELVRAIIALARRTGVAVTAEGVERQDQLRLVRGLGFTHAQGFVTGPPVEDPAALIEAPQPAL